MEINALGQACPLPVIKAKQAINEHPGEEIIILVDNEAATENLKKLSGNMGMTSEVKEESPNVYRVKISGTREVNSVSSDGYVIVLASNEMGGGDADFGKKLLEGFIYAITEQDELPKAILLYNSGVYMATENLKSIEDLTILAGKGVEVLSCGLCLDFYGLKEKLAVGEITNMYRICELMTQYRVVRP